MKHFVKSRLPAVLQRLKVSRGSCDETVIEKKLAASYLFSFHRQCAPFQCSLGGTVFIAVGHGRKFVEPASVGLWPVIEKLESVRSANTFCHLYERISSSFVKSSANACFTNSFCSEVRNLRTSRCPREAGERTCNGPH